MGKTLKRPSWNQSSENILIGIEHEFFIFQNGQAPSLPTMHAFYQRLCANGYSASKEKAGFILEVRKNLKTGYVAINNDFCTHILEIAMPPLVTASEVSQMFDEVMADITLALKEQGISIFYDSTLPDVNFQMELVPHERREWYKNRRAQSISRLWHPYPTTLMTSTQVHLNILDGDFYQKLPQFYQLEYLYPLFFSNSRCILKNQFHCARPIIWQQNKPLQYNAWAFPGNIPMTRESYQKMLDQIEYFSRDFSFISPRSFGTAEFRSACSQKDLSSILELVALRLAVVQLLFKSHDYADARPLVDAQENFFSVCEKGVHHQEILEYDLFFLKAASEKLPFDWKQHFDRFFRRAALLKTGSGKRQAA